MTALADLLIGDSALLLYFSEPRTRNRKCIMVTNLQNLLIFISVFYRVSRFFFFFFFLSVVTMIVRIKQDDNFFKTLAILMLI